MWFGVLGAIVLRTDGGDPVPLVKRKARTLLALLLAHCGEPVSVDRLIDAIWEGAPPAHPKNALQALVSQIRRALVRAEPDAITSSRPGRTPELVGARTARVSVGTFVA